MFKHILIKFNYFFTKKIVKKKKKNYLKEIWLYNLPKKKKEIWLWVCLVTPPNWLIAYVL
jgi:hypothetical protein